MNERIAMYAANAFAVVSAILVVVSSFLPMSPFNPTFYSGSTLVMTYLLANPKLLTASRLERVDPKRKARVVPIALVLGLILMLSSFFVPGLRGNAT